MTTARTEPVELKTVGLDREPIRGGHLLLQSFNIAIGKLHDLATAGADEVVVVSLVRNVVILSLRTEVPGLRQTGFAKEVERAINRRQSQVRIFFCQLVIHLLGGDVFLLEECVENEFTLTREL